MQRYFVPLENWQLEKVEISGADAHHIHRVMRNEIGDQVICNHPDGRLARCEIKAFEPSNVLLKVSEWLLDNHELPVQVTIAQGLPKGNKLDLILQKGTELGAVGFHLYAANRSIAKWDNKKLKQRLPRFDKIVKEASEQSYRNSIPKIDYTPSLLTLLEEVSSQYDAILFAYEEEAKSKKYHSFGEALKQINENDKLLICIGPEGGFSEEEVIELKNYEAQSVRLGARILRTETASLYALSAISYHFEEKSHS